MENDLVFALVACGQAVLGISVLARHLTTNPATLPLVLFIAVMAIVAAMPVAASQSASVRTVYAAFLPPAFLLMGPGLWLYVKGLTSETRWKLKKEDGWHMLLPAAGLMATAMILGLPEGTRDTMFFAAIPDHMLTREDGVPLYAGVVAIVLFFLVIAWLFQSVFYAARILRSLAHYRARLKDLFANNDQRELYWLNGILCIIGGIWLMFFSAVIADNFFDRRLYGQEVASVFPLVLIWTASFWGIGQKPGFENRYVPAEDSPRMKYQRSAMDEEQAGRIAARLNKAMAEDRLYLDANLSLPKLAKHMAISANKISQTLNESLNVNFFDYVNGWRIEAARKMLRDSDMSVLDISLAVGFNARSSFYKAFRHHTGQTPSAFRQGTGQP